MKYILFTDAHINNKNKAIKVKEFLSSHKEDKIICLGDLFDSMEDFMSFGRLLDYRKFTWIRGNHEYWIELPKKIVIDDVLITHGHELLVTAPFESLSIRATPKAKKIGVFEPTIKLGRSLEDTLGKPISSLLFWISSKTGNFKTEKKKFALIIIGHLHHHFIHDHVVVLPKFPSYAILDTEKRELIIMPENERVFY